MRLKETYHMKTNEPTITMRRRKGEEWRGASWLGVGVRAEKWFYLIQEGH
jgi:hypothetical protein